MHVWVRCAIVTLVAVSSTMGLTASEDGIFGRFQAGCGGGACHGGAANDATTVTLNGPTTIRTGETHDYTFVVAHRDQDAAGMNVAFRTGAGAAAGDITPGNNQRGGVDQVTHDGPLALVNRSAEFDFEWEAPDDHGVYTFNGAGNAVDDNGQRTNDVWNVMTKQITVKGATLTGPGDNESVCQDGVLNITWTQTGITTIRIELSDDNFVTSENIANTVDAGDNEFNYTIPGNQEPSNTYRVRLIDTDGDVELARSGVFVISGGPLITGQPEDQEICEGQTLLVTVVATGNAITYQWRKNGVDIPNANEAILRITNVAPSQSGDYDCVVEACGVEVTSEVATVTVLEKVKITEQPQDVSVCLGQPAQIEVSASGEGVTYQWLKNGLPISGERTRVLSIAETDLEDDARYACRISGDCPPQRVTDTVSLSIIELPVITTQPVPSTIAFVGGRVELIVETEGTELEFEWLKDGEAITAPSSPSLVIDPIALADSGMYSVVIYNDCDTIQSERSKISVFEEEAPGRLALGTTMVDVGEVVLCTEAELTIEDAMSNVGTLDLVVAAPTIDPLGTFSITAPVFPLTLAGGVSADLSISIPVDTLGDFVRLVVFSDGDSTQTITIVGVGVSALHGTPDTLVFERSSTGETMCVTTLPFECPQIVVTGITLGGEGASTYEVESPAAVPVTIGEGEELDFCVRSTDTTSLSAMLTVESDQGSFTVPIIRRGVTSVDEERFGIKSLTVVPNPMTEDVLISSQSAQTMSVVIYSVLGNQLTQLEGEGQIHWDGRDSSGRLLSAGVYVLHIRQGSKSSLVKLVVER